MRFFLKMVADRHHIDFWGVRSVPTCSEEDCADTEDTNHSVGIKACGIGESSFGAEVF